MILKQFYLGCLAHASYLIGDEGSGQAVVVDPQRDIEQYLLAAENHGLRIEHVMLTHFHADFVAGHLELRSRVGAKIYLGSRARAEFDFVPMQEGVPLEMGAVRLEFLETPGHTPESVCILVFDTEADPEKPQAVLTGDTLFIGDVGRPDLMASQGVSQEELAASLHDSIFAKLLKLPDSTLVYPAHGAGSMCGKNLSKETVSTIGKQKQQNYALKARDKAEFIRLVSEGQQPAPAYFAYDAELNRQERPLLDDALEKGLQPLSEDQLGAAVADGAQLLDVRSKQEFAGGHLLGSLHIGLEGKFASWAGTLLDKDRTIVLVANPGSEREAAMRLGRIGFDRVVGYLAGGVPAAHHTLESLPGIEPDELELAMALQGGPCVLDVRSEGEHEAMMIPRTLHIPLGSLAERLGELPRDQSIVVLCASGYRSSTAASLLRRQRFADVSSLLGGIQAWHKAGLPVRVGSLCGDD